MKHAHRVGRSLLQLLGVAALCVCALQVVFVLRVALMAAVDPSSTTSTPGDRSAGRSEKVWTASMISG